MSDAKAEGSAPDLPAAPVPVPAGGDAGGDKQPTGGEPVSAAPVAEEGPATQAEEGPLRSCLRGDGNEKPSKSAHVTVTDEVMYARDVLFNPVDDEEAMIERLYDTTAREQRLKEAAEKIRKEREEAEMKDVTFVPAINKDVGRPQYPHFSDFVDAQNKWVEDMAKKLKHKAKMQADIVDSQRSSLDQMSKTTKRLVQCMKKEQRYAGPIKGWDEHYAAFLARRAGMVTDEDFHGPEDTSFTPVISPYASNKAARERGDRISSSPLRHVWEDSMQRGDASAGPQLATARESVFNRLYEESAVRTAMGKVLRDSYNESLVTGLFEPQTNETWTAATASEDYASTAGSGSLLGARHPDVVVDTLLAKGRTYHEKKQRARELHEQEAAERFTFRPATNKQSRRILAEYARRCSTDLEEELARQRLDADSRETSQSRADSLPEGVRGIPRPKAAAKFDTKTFCKRRDYAQALRDAKVEQLREERRESELNECTFRPSLCKRTIREHSPPGSPRPHGLVDAFSNRSTYSCNFGSQGSPRGAAPAAPVPAPSSARPSARPSAVARKAPVSHPEKRLGYESMSPVHLSASRPRASAAPVRAGAAAATAYTIPLSSTDPSPRHVRPRSAGGSSTASARHQHNDMTQPDSFGDSYLDDLEDEMQGVLNSWRSGP